MSQSLPSLRALEVFEAAARHSSFTKAAEEVHVTQSAVSHLLRELEEQLSYKLFHREGRRLVLTPEGRRLATTLSEAFGAIRTTLTQLEREQRGGGLTVSVSPSFAVHWLVPRLEALRRALPDQDLRLSASDEVVDPRTHQVDLCIRYGEGHYPGLDVEHLCTDRVFPVCSPALARSLRSPSQLRDHRLLSDEMFAGHPRRLDWRQWGAVAGVDLSGAAEARFSHAGMALTAALAGQGVALGRSVLVADEIRAGRLVCPFGPSLPCPFSYWLVAPRGSLSRPRLAPFAQWIRATLQGDLIDPVGAASSLPDSAPVDKRT